MKKLMVALVSGLMMAAMQRPAQARADDGSASHAAEGSGAPLPASPPAETATATHAPGDAYLAVIPLAQTPPPVPAASDPDGSDDAQHLAEVIVTATKRSVPLREIPASIASLDGDDLEKRGTQGLEDIVRLVPGVNLATEIGR